MKFLSDQNPTPALMAAVATCVAHRCVRHQQIPPLNRSEGNGSSECAICAVEDTGQQLAAKAIEIVERDVLCPILDGYADRLEHHALLMDTLMTARRQMVLAGLEVRFIDEVLNGTPSM